MCPPGQQLAAAHRDVGDRLNDYPCEACGKGCGPRQITLMSPAYNSLNATRNNTCNGAGGNYYACYDGQGSGTTWAATPGQRLQYPTPNTTSEGWDGSVEPGTRATLETCDAGLLPLHSRFVVRRLLFFVWGCLGECVRVCVSHTSSLTLPEARGAAAAALLFCLGMPGRVGERERA